MILESLFGGALGGLLRLAPEFMKLWDRKDERKHELAMLGAEMEFARMRGEIQMRQVDASMSVADLQAVGEALKGQAEMAKAGGKIVAAISALVRPIVTYWFVGLYSANKIASMLMAHEQAGGWRDVLITSWTEQDWTVLSMILSFWFVGRVWERSTKR